jgi:hypothetical protein
MSDTERLARYLFEHTAKWRWMASSEDARWDEWVERNQDEWRAEAADLLAFLAAAPASAPERAVLER